VTPDIVVRAENVTKKWGATIALDGATLQVGRGVTGLLGANGAGKTTLLGMVLGLHRPDAGRLEVLGHDPWTAGPDVRAMVGYAPEHEALPLDVRAHDFVRHMAELHGIPYREAVARASDTLFEVGLGEERFRPIGTMSTGQKQRVKLAQAIVHDPALVLLDEPTNGLDPVQREQMLALVRRCGAELGLNVVFCSHLLEEVERTCDEVVILAGGRVQAGGALHDLERASDALLLELDGPSEAVAAALQNLRAAGLEVRLLDEHGDERRVRVAGAGVEVHDLVRDVLDDAEVGLRRLQREGTTLAEVFLEASSRP
jgi:ABC-2 type transport system ATP-binding protein